MKTKQRMRLEIKEISAEGSFEGMLSPYGNVDQGDDVVLPGAYTKTLKEQGPTRPLLWQHKTDQPIGQLTLEDRPEGLWCKGQLLMALDEAKKAYLLMKAGIVKGLSIGFESVKDSIDGGVRKLKEIKLYEGSVVTFPMNEMALISSVKDAADGDAPDFIDELTEIQLRSAADQMMNALYNALCEVRWSDLSKDDQIKASQAIIDQFSEAYMAYLPQYADMMAEMYGGMESMGKRELEIKATKKTKRVDGVDLTADCFAYVGDPEKTDTWKLPIKFPGDDEKTKSHIRNALVRFDQTQGIPDGERAKVLAKIHAAAKKHGIDVGKSAIAAYVLEEKAGRKISAATRAKVQEAQGHMDKASDHHKSAYDIMSALASAEAEEEDPKSADLPSTSTPQAAETKTEPDPLHSAAQAFDDLISLVRAA